ncbi:MAG: hypothetical protein R3E94_19700, partial [Burkholderiaceae bacterium]
MQTGVNVKQQLFDTVQIRTAWDEAQEKWWFSALDVVAALTDQSDYTKARNYWKWLKGKLKQEGSEVVSATHQLKLEGRWYRQRGAAEPGSRNGQEGGQPAK